MLKIIYLALTCRALEGFITIYSNDIAIERITVFRCQPCLLM